MELNRYIDHTLLSPTASKQDINRLCAQAIEYKFRAVCIHPAFVEYTHELIRSSGCSLATVVGFPLGVNTTKVKVYEATLAVKQGAREIDMVLNLGWFKAKKYKAVIAEIKQIKQAVGQEVLLKVIIETGYLNNQEKRIAARCVAEAGADFVKTSTGFGPTGATLEDIILLHSQVGAGLGIKASGGIKTKDTAIAMIQAGATRIGTSNGVGLLT